MNLDELFNRVSTGETVILLHRNKNDYLSTVTMVRRKWRNYRELMLGFDPEHPCKDQYVQCVFDATTVSGTYKLANTDNRITAKVYLEKL